MAIFLPILIILTVTAMVNADELSDINNAIAKKEAQYQSTSKKLADIQTKKDAIAAQITKLGSQLNVTQAEIKDLEDSISQAEKELAIINDNLNNRKDSLTKKIALRNEVIRDYSKKGVLNDLELLFAAAPTASLNGFQFSTLNYIFDKSLTQDTLQFIDTLNGEITAYEKDKAEGEKLKQGLEDDQNKLLALKNQLQNQQNLALNQKNNLQQQESSYQKDLANITKALDELTAKQQSILNAKSGEGDNGSVGDYEAPEVKTPSAPFSPAFAAFSYGAYSHYKGMSQYGAKGRADSGQSYKDILKFYYETGTTSTSTSNICVSGYGTMSFQKYLYGIAEMPSTWDSDALKAQAVAARSYANRYAKDGKCICTTQSCQVFSKSKSDSPPSSWKSAVDATKGVILSGSVIAYYSSTTGGYIDNVGWDGSWPSSSYEKKAGSPWFRKAWYTKSYNDASTCGRSYPWLKSEELADIINSYVVWSHGTSDEKDRISPVTTSCWGGDPYSISDMREKADKYGKSYSSVSSIEATSISNGQTTKVHIVTDNGSLDIDGQVFKTVYNLRAPSYLSIKSRLFDFEKK